MDSSRLGILTTPLLAAGIGLALVFSGELVLRSETVRSRLPAPPLSGVSPIVDLHFEQFATAGADFDCVFLGNSMGMQGFDPEEFARAYGANAPRCYNFSLPGLSARGAASIAQIITTVRPLRLLVYGVGVRDFSARDAAPDVFSSPWLRHRAGQFNVDGWLIEHLVSYRYLQLLRSRGQRQPDLPPSLRISSRGHLQVDRVGDVSSATVVASKRMLIEHLAAGISEAQRASFEDILEQQSPACTVAIVELPINPVLGLEDGELEGAYGEFLDVIERLTVSQGGIFVATHSRVAIPAGEFTDPWHLNAQGAARFSRWLAAVFAGQRDRP
jgi:hypothetical protein